MKTKKKTKRRSRRDEVLEYVRNWYFKDHWIGKRAIGFTHIDTIRLKILSSCLGHATGWMRLDTEGKPRQGLAQTQDEIADYCEKLLERVFDDTICNDDCKFMYFCDKKKGHKGKHGESGLAWD